MTRSWAVDIVNGNDTQQTVVQPTYTITGATKASPCVITVGAGHGFADGDYGWIVGCGGMTQINSLLFYFKYISSTQFSLYSDAGLTTPINSSAYTTYTSGGTVNGSQTKASPISVTCPGHGFQEGQWVYTNNLNTMTQINSLPFKVVSVTSTRFSLQNPDGTAVNSTTYTVGGAGVSTFTTYSMQIGSITKANPAVVTCTTHGFNNGDVVFISCEGMTQMDKRCVTVASKTATTFQCSGVDSTGFSTFTGGTVRKPYLNVNTLNAVPYQILNESANTSGFNVYLAKTFTPGAGITTGSGNIVFTNNSPTVTTSVDLTASIAVGNLIGLTTAVGTGCATDPRITKPDVYYRVSAISASSITLQQNYAGTTTTVSSVYRLRIGTEIRTTGIASTVAITWTQTNAIIEGGYDFSGGVITRNGETFISPVTQNADNLYSWYFATAVGNILRYVGFAGGWRSFYDNGNNITEYCSAFPTQYVGFHNQSSTSTIRYCYAMGANGSQALCAFIMAGTGLVQYCYGTSGTGNIFTFYINVTGGRVQYCLADRAYTGFSGMSNVVAVFDSCEARYCISGYQLNTQNYATNIVASNCTYGLYTPTLTRGLVVNTFTITSCTYGIYLTQSQMLNFYNLTMNSNGRDVYADGYCANIYFVNMVSSTPSTYSFDVTAFPSTYVISNFSIDAPSIAKAFSGVYASASYFNPSYTLTGCSQFPDGSYWQNGSYVKDSTTYRTNGSSMKLALTPVSQYLAMDTKMFSFFVKTGTGKTITLYMQRHASWTGSVIPKLKLNGVTKVTGTTLTQTDIGTSWSVFSWTIPGGSVTQDGELSLEFNYNATSNPLWIDDIVVS